MPYPFNIYSNTLLDIVKGEMFHSSISPSKSMPRPLGYWTKNEGANMKLFLDEFAKKRNMDPLNPNDWYTVKSYDLVSAGVISHFSFIFFPYYFYYL